MHYLPNVNPLLLKRQPRCALFGGVYLREQFGSLERKTAAEMVRRLHEAGSVAILALAFDSAMLQRTISDLLLIPQLFWITC